MSQIQSIDINHFLAREQVTSVTPTPTQIPAELTDIFSDLLPAPVSWRMSHNENEEVLHFEMKMTRENFSLEEEKQGKKRVFELDFQKSFLRLNQRRAMSEDITLFSDRLKQWAVYFQKKPITWKTTWKDPSQKTPDNTALLTQLATEALLGLSRKLSSKQIGSDTPDAVRVIRDQLREILSSQGKKVIITNRKKINSQLNTVYTLEITAEKASFEEKTATMRNVIDLDMSALSLFLNKTPMKPAGIQWFVQKLETLGHDLSQERAEMYRI